MKKNRKDRLDQQFLLRHAIRCAKRRSRRNEVEKMQNIDRNYNNIGRRSTGKPMRRKVNQTKLHYKSVLAPGVFSFIENAEGVARFISELNRLYIKNKEVFVRMSEVIRIDYSAIVVLLSIMVKFKSSGIPFNGDFPINPTAKRMLVESGFFKYIGESIEEEDRYDLSKGHGIHTHAFKNVDAPLGSEIILSASNTIWGEARRCQGVQATLLELMQNTNNHADIEKKGVKHWWLSVQHVKKERKVIFSFVDFGVGIFQSLARKPANDKFFGILEKLKRLFTSKDNADVLRLILRGELHKTVTGQYYRGKGLPGIADAMERKQLSGLYIITNDVYANIAKGEFNTMSYSFDGTFVCWEVSEENASCK